MFAQIVTNYTDSVSFVNAMNAWAEQNQYFDAFTNGFTDAIPFWVVVVGFSIVRSYLTEKEDI